MKTKVAFGVLAAGMLLLIGCGVPMTRYEGVFERYYSVTLGLTTSADVLEIIHDREEELLSQSDSVLTAWGKEGKKDRTHWFNMVAFDQDSAVAVRKYGFVLEETAVGPNRQPRPGLRFDAEIKMDAATLDEPYPSANARRIAVLRRVLEVFGDDAQDVTFDSVTLKNSTLMVNQAINVVLVKLMQSPALAAHLPEPGGLEFDHPTLDRSFIRMLIEDDIVKVKIKAGKPWPKTPFEEHPDVKNM